MTEIEAPPTAFYTIVAPKSFRPYAKFDVAITLHDPEHVITEPCTIRVHIEDAEDERWYVNEHRAHVKPNTTEIVTINVEELATTRQYKLVVASLTGLAMKHEANLLLQSKIHAILIQTDKAIYKPCDCVKFRVLVLDEQLKASVLRWDKLNIVVSVGEILLFI